MRQRHPSQVAEALRRARQEARMSLRELAARAGTSHATVLAYEQGTKVPGAATFMRLLEACGYVMEMRLDRRIRERDGLSRGDELEQVLRLAEQFPVQVPRQMDYPRLPR